jgi:hypothetical protein
MCFQGNHIRLWANAFCAVFPGSSSLESQGEYSIKRSLGEMIALQAQAEKFLVSLFSKSDDGSLRTVETKKTYFAGGIRS